MIGFKRSLLVGTLAAGMLLAGCAQPGGSVGGRSASSGSMALSTDDSTLYAVDTDNGVVAVIDTKTDAKLYTVKVGSRPARVVVGTDDTLYVTNRGDNTVSVIRKGEHQASATLDVGTEPVGIAVSPDNKTLYVVNSTGTDSAEYGTLSGFSVNTLQPTFETKLGAEPRGIALVSNDKAVVSLLKEGELVEVDLKSKSVVSPKIGIHDAANLTRVTGGKTVGFSSFQARAMTEVVATPDGTRVFAPVIWAREDAIGRKPTSAGGYYSAGGPCNIGAVATAGIVVADQGASGSNGNGGSFRPQVDDLTSCFDTGLAVENKEYPSTTLTGRTGTNATPTQIQGPSAAALDPTGTFVFVVNKESKNVAVMPAYRRSGEDLDFRTTGTSVRFLVGVGAGADGIAMTRDAKKAYVYNQFDHTVSLLVLEGEGPSAKMTNMKTIVVASDTLAPEIVRGRKMFFDAVDQRLSSNTTTVSCGTCHLEGLDDSHTWSFPDGPRQTPTLAGRHLLATAPYHWSGEFGGPTALKDFMTHTIRERMGGTGLDTATQANDIASFIESIPAPRNANLKIALNAKQAHGKDLFQSAQCATCHTSSNGLFTNDTNQNVGTLVMSGKNPDNGLVVTNGINVPSLLGLARSAPYLHDGSSPSLSDRINRNEGDLHGITSNLSETDKADLVEYLKTL